MEHTGGKWRPDPDYGNFIIMVEKKEIAQIFHKPSLNPKRSIPHKEAEANAERICLCVNGWDELEKQRDALLNHLIDAELAYSAAINRTPTSSYREKLSKMNIKRLQAIALCEK